MVASRRALVAAVVVRDLGVVVRRARVVLLVAAVPPAARVLVDRLQVVRRRVHLRAAHPVEVDLPVAHRALAAWEAQVPPSTCPSQNRSSTT